MTLIIKIITAGFSRVQVYCHQPSAFCPPPFQSKEDERLHTLCPDRAISIYVEHTRALWRSNQLFVCYGSQTAGTALSKEHLSNWIVEAITLVYSVTGQVPPESLRAHSTRSVATSWTFFTRHHSGRCVCCCLLGHPTHLCEVL